MKRKKVFLIINPRVGKNIAQLRDVIAVFSAAEWKTDIALMEFGGHAMVLAARAADAGYDLVLAYGGDGTLNQVVNGVVTVKGRSRTVGVIPGGTANVWAGEVGVPVHPVKAALSLVNSEGRKVDIGHVEVESLTLLPSPLTVEEPPPTAGTDGKRDPKTKGRKRAVQPASGGRHHFLLMAGLGIDATIMGRVSTALKEKIGVAAVAITAAKELPSAQPFPVEIRSSTGGRDARLVWRGDAMQVVVGNTRRYGNIVEVTPEAYIDDGMLDVCVITAGTPLTTMEQIVSFVLHRKPGNASSETFRGAHLWISVPASIAMQLDGSAVQLKDFLKRPDREALQEAGVAERTMVKYRFDSMAGALRMAVPYAYDDALFADGPDAAKTLATEQQQADSEKSQPLTQKRTARSGHQSIGGEDLAALVESGRKVTVIGAGPNRGQKGTYIIAGTTSKESTGELKAVAVRVGSDTAIFGGTGERLRPAAVAGLTEGSEIVVEGAPSKRGVMRAKRVVLK